MSPAEFIEHYARDCGRTKGARRRMTARFWRELRVEQKRARGWHGQWWARALEREFFARLKAAVERHWGPR